MRIFVKMQEFKDLNVVFALDEGCPSITDEIPVFYGERSPWWIHVKCKGTPGHASMLKPDTAGEKFYRFVDKMMKFRDGQKTKYDWTYDNQQQMGETLSVNLTMVEGGKQPNVIPSHLTATFDCRIPPNIDLTKFENQLNAWAKEIDLSCGGPGDSIEITFSQQEKGQAICDVNGEQCAPFWKPFKAAVEKAGMKPRLSIFPAATDCRYVREEGISALGFSPIPLTPFLLHDHDEYVSTETFLKGITVYVDILKGITAA